ncbi:MAG: hypothetical protein FWE32_00250 [Oscillospiraceae bacterium]|nr:hypothetical protein [Oscillospiraceae bacterium]
MQTSGFRQELRDIADPIERRKKIETADHIPEADRRAAAAWWEARYTFANKKKTQAADRFIWFLLSLWGYSAGSPSIKGKQLVSTYRETFLTPEVETAFALADCLSDEVRDASAAYILTIDLNPGMFGFKMGKQPSKQENLKKVAEVVSGRLLPGLYGQCGELKHADTIARGIWQGAAAAYPGVEPVLKAEIDSHPDQAMRAFVLAAIDE